MFKLLIGGDDVFQSTDASNTSLPMNKNNYGTTSNSSVNSSNKVNGYVASSSQKNANGTSGFDGLATNSVNSNSGGSGNGSLPKGVPPVCPTNTLTSSGGGPRLSYAQVAQHHKEKSEMEKQLQHVISTATTTMSSTPPLSSSSSLSTPSANSHHNSVVNSVTVNTATSVTAATTTMSSTVKSLGNNANTSTSNTSFSDNDKKDNAVQSVSSKQSKTCYWFSFSCAQQNSYNGHILCAGGGNSIGPGQKERPTRGNRQNNQSVNEREKDHPPGKNSRRERRGEQNSKFSQTC